MSHYEILGINSAASKSEIMKAFRQQSLIYHPDKQGGKKVSDDTNDYFIALVNAKEVLLDEEKRRLYNEELERKRAERFQRYRGNTQQQQEQQQHGNNNGNLFTSIRNMYHRFLTKYVQSDTTLYFIYNALMEFLTIRGFLNFCFVLAIASVIIQFFLPLILNLLYKIFCSCICSRSKVKQQVLYKNMRAIREEQQRRHMLLSSKTGNHSNNKGKVKIR